MYIYIYGTLWDHVLAKTKDTAERGWPDAQWLVSTSNDSSGATWGRKQKSTLELGGSGKFWRKAQILWANYLSQQSQLWLCRHVCCQRKTCWPCLKNRCTVHTSPEKHLVVLNGIAWHYMAVHLPACYNTSSNMLWTHVYNTFRNCSLVLLAMSCLTHQSSRRQKACGANMVSLSTWKRYLTRKKTFRDISGYLKQTIELLSSNRTSPYFSIVQGSPSGRAKFLDLMLPESSTNKVFLPRIQFECKLKIYQNLGHKSLNVEVDWVDRIKQKRSKTYEVPRTSIVTGFESIHSVPGPEQSSNKWGRGAVATRSSPSKLESEWFFRLHSEYLSNMSDFHAPSNI